MLALLLVATTLFTQSCRKKESLDSDTSGASDNALAEGTANDITNIGSQAADNTTGTTSSLDSYRTANPNDILSTCAANITWSPSNKIVTVEFNGSTCLDGRTRTGTLTFNYSASAATATHFRDPGFSCSVTSTNYVVDGNQVNIISKTITNTTPVGFDPATTNEKWTVASNIEIIKAGGAGTITWTCNRTTTLLNTSTVYTGAANPINWPMAKISVSGSASGTRANGESFTCTASDLVRDFGGCNIFNRHPFISGTLDYTPSGKSTRHIDFGAGACDATATVTIDGAVYTITLI